MTEPPELAPLEPGSIDVHNPAGVSGYEKYKIEKQRRNSKPTGRRKKHSAELSRKAAERVAVLANIRKRLPDAQRKLGIDALTRSWIEKDQLSVEPALQESMWVQYRYMSPWERDEAFYKAYEEQRRIRLGELYKPGPAPGELAWCSLDEINAINRARIEADRAGMPYDLYCQIVIESHMVKDKWEQLPRPNQMYGKLDMPRMRCRLTQHEIGKRLCGPDWHPRFLAKNYAGDPVQEAALQLIRQDVHGSTYKANRLRMYLRERHAITRERATQMFGTELVSEALGRLNHLPGEREAGRYTLGCFGYHIDADGVPCPGCPLLESCKSYVAAVVEETAKLSGSEHPRLDHQRALSAKRAQESYERRRKRLGKHVTPRKRPRTSAAQVGVTVARLRKHQRTSVPDFPDVYPTPDGKEMEAMFDGL